MSSIAWPATTWERTEQPAVCRTNGCSTPTIDDELGLCEECGWWQRVRQHERPKEAPRRGRALTLPTLEPAPSWAAQGACAGRGPEAFFSDDVAVTEQAKAICISCQVRKGCLDLALACPSLQGVWGGLDEDERRQTRNASGNHCGNLSD